MGQDLTLSSPSSETAVPYSYCAFTTDLARILLYSPSSSRGNVARETHPILLPSSPQPAVVRQHLGSKAWQLEYLLRGSPRRRIGRQDRGDMQPPGPLSQDEVSSWQAMRNPTRNSPRGSTAPGSCLRCYERWSSSTKVRSWEEGASRRCQP